jgi:hypothetical protein
LPLFVFTLGMSLAIPSLTLLALDMFPEQRGLAASCQAFLQAAVNALAAALIVPVLWESTLSLALGMGGPDACSALRHLPPGRRSIGEALGDLCQITTHLACRFARLLGYDNSYMSSTMRLLSRLEDDRKSAAIWYVLFRQSPYLLCWQAVSLAKGIRQSEMTRQRPAG